MPSEPRARATISSWPGACAAARANDVVANRADQNDVRIQPIANDCIDSLHIVAAGGNKRGEIQDVSGQVKRAARGLLPLAHQSGGFDQRLYGVIQAGRPAAALAAQRRSRRPS